MKHFFQNQKTDLIQKTAWRLVRSAHDIFGTGKGNEKRQWCIRRFKELHPDILEPDAEDFIRSAFMNFLIEMSVLERKY